MRYLGILVLLVALFVGAGQVLAETVTTGFQQYLVVSAAKPTGIGSVTFTGQKLWTAKSKGECTIANIGLKNSVTVNGIGLTVEPNGGYVGGWYPGSDAFSVGSQFGAKRGPFALNLSFDWFTNTSGGYQQHTKFWLHKLGYTSGSWTAGTYFQKVDQMEKVAPFLAFKGGPHWTVEGRWYRSLNQDPKLHKYVENGRLVLKIS